MSSFLVFGIYLPLLPGDSKGARWIWFLCGDSDEDEVTTTASATCSKWDQNLRASSGLAIVAGQKQWSSPSKALVGSVRTRLLLRCMARDGRLVKIVSRSMS